MCTQNIFWHCMCIHCCHVIGIRILPPLDASPKYVLDFIRGGDGFEHIMNINCAYGSICSGQHSMPWNIVWMCILIHSAVFLMCPCALFANEKRNGEGGIGGGGVPRCVECINSNLYGFDEVCTIMIVFLLLSLEKQCSLCMWHVALSRLLVTCGQYVACSFTQCLSTPHAVCILGF